MSVDKYTRTAMTIHWLTVVLIALLFGLGWYMVDLPKGPARGYYFALHKSLGLCAFALLVLRAAWRLRHRPPPFPISLPNWEARLARAVHLGFYLLLVLQPASGYLSSSFSGYATQWFGVPLPNWGYHDAPLNEFFTEVHELCAVGLLILIAAHVLGFCKHLLSGESTLWRRMWPW